MDVGAWRISPENFDKSHQNTCLSFNPTNQTIRFNQEMSGVGKFCWVTQCLGHAIFIT